MLRERPELRRGAEVALPLPWEPLDHSQRSRYAPIRGDAANFYESVLIMSLPPGGGYPATRLPPCAARLNYKGSIWLKQIEGPEAVKITLRRYEQKNVILAS